jgi:hypothetical protein
MAEKRDFFGYETKITYTNPSSGVSTYEFNEELFFKIKDFVKDVMKEEEFKPKEVIRDFRETASGNFSFKAGGGYTISDELVGGSGSSIMSRTFEAFLEYDKDRTEKKLDRLNEYIENCEEVKRLFPNATKFEGYEKKYEAEEKEKAELKLENLLLKTKEITINAIKEELVENKNNRFELSDINDKNSISEFLDDKDNSIEKKVNLTLLSDDPNRIYNILTEKEKQIVLGDKNETVNDVYILANIDEARKEVINQLKENIKKDEEGNEFLKVNDFKKIENEIEKDKIDNKKELEKFEKIDISKEKEMER